MSEAAIVLWIIGICAFTMNVAIICNTAENIAKIKYGFQDPEANYTRDLKRRLEANEIGIIRGR